MTTLTMRVVKGDFIVTGPDIAPMKFKTLRWGFSLNQFCCSTRPMLPR
jgi:hypothetical protein